MHKSTLQARPYPPKALNFHLLGTVGYDDCLALQRRLVFEERGNDGRCCILLCEHPPLITIGCSGSRGHIRLRREQLTSGGLRVRYVRRGGGCILHGLGQLCIYCVAPLQQLGWSMDGLLRRLTSALLETMHTLNIHGQTSGVCGGVWGRSGLLAAVGGAVEDGMSFHGAFLNVNPAPAYFGFIDTVDPYHCEPGLKSTMGSLLAEKGEGVKMAGVRSALIEQVALALQCENYHLHTGHPYLIKQGSPTRESRRSA